MQKSAILNGQVRQSTGKVVMAMVGLPRYRHQTLGDLQRLVLEPLIRDRIAIAQPQGTDRDALIDMSGVAIRASVSKAVDASIREQVKTGTFAIRQKPDDWTSGQINWRLDATAPDRKMTGRVIANFWQVMKEGELRLHPMVAWFVEPDMMERMGAENVKTAK